MKWTIKNKVVFGEDGQVVCVLPDEAEDYIEKTIEVAPEAIEAINDFVNQVNSGSLKPRTAVKVFEKILEKYNS